MEQQDTDNEPNLRQEQILNSACKEFLKHGKSGTKMQQIADAAGVNKALVYYYYHSKDQIFHAVVEHNFKILMDGIAHNVNFSEPLKTIVHQYIHNHIQVITDNRELFQFFSGEVWMNPHDLITGISESLRKQTKKLYKALKERIEKSVQNKEIRPIDPLHLLLNIVSLDVFYFIAAPIVFPLTGTKASAQKRIEKERENEVFEFIWESIRYRGADESDCSSKAKNYDEKIGGTE